ncbi:MAG: UDP-N-acetylmuramoylalanine--D-glutamate ligase [Phycisphaeraceae bacterium]|nr:MAG: UDP-N-acetylmuramoylalanine--D-glutamate ligase [Phycisphaeraceae bacterium]
MGEFDGQRWVVMGLGRFGGGLGVTRWLCAQGADVLVTDTAEEDDLHASLADLRPLIADGRVELRLGEHNVSDFTTCDGVVINPAVPTPWENRFVRAAKAGGARVTTEIQLAVERLGADRVVAITGTAGKSTTAAMTARALEACDIPCLLGGNIGGSALDTASRLDARTVVVLEVSSAMLWWLAEGEDGTAFGPRVAVVTNFAPNHIDWHGSADHYRACKRAILRGQKSGDAAIIAGDESSNVAVWATRPGVDRVAVRQGLAGCVLPGSHNAMNGAIALAAAGAGARLIAGVELDADRAAAAVRAYTGLPHRLQLIHEAAGVQFFDDSKSTVPDATRLAVGAVGAARCHLIAGGYDKGIDLAPIANLAPDLAGLYTIGATGGAIAAAANGHATPCVTIEAAIDAILARAKPGDAVLLSPGCASWDQYAHYEARGDRFAQLARERARR